MRDPILQSAELTGEWEAKLQAVEKGSLEPEAFMAEVETFTRTLVEPSDASALDPSRLGACPRCGASVIEGKRGFGCSQWQAGCGFVLWKRFEGVDISADAARALLQRRGRGAA